MTIPDLVLRSRRAVLPDGVRPASLLVRNGRIAAIGAYEEVPTGVRTVDAGEVVLSPGAVDTHVHVNEPGRTEWEGFETATAAAAAGGVTTLLDMPLNSLPPTTTRQGLAAKIAAASGRVRVDVGFWGGAVPGNLGEMPALWESGVFGFKCFLLDSGVPEFPPLDESGLRAALVEVARLGAVLLVHAELAGPIDAAARASAGGRAPDPRRYASWLEARPRAAENEAVALLVRLARETGARVHVVHLSSAEALPELRAARAAGIFLTAETCPHYLTLAAEEIEDGATAAKCAPPIREAANRDALWAGLAEGLVSMVVSDHSPSPAGLKCADTGDFLRAWGGISSLELSLPLLWTGVLRRGLGLAELARWRSEGPARLAGLADRKGSLAVGRDADLVLWNPESTFRVDPAELHHRHPVSPYGGCELAGVVQATYLRGQCVYERGTFPAAAAGRLLVRGQG